MKLSNVNCKYGAPMGRSDKWPEGTPADVKLYLRHMPLDSGGYDAGGAYWGQRIAVPVTRSDGIKVRITPRLYWYTNTDRSVFGTLEAVSRAHAKELIRCDFPKVRFYR
jgi:hypothetical protein